jgi:hypothetical protein
MTISSISDLMQIVNPMVEFSLQNPPEGKNALRVELNLRARIRDEDYELKRVIIRKVVLIYHRPNRYMKVFFWAGEHGKSLPASYPCIMNHDSCWRGLSELRDIERELSDLRKETKESETFEKDFGFFMRPFSWVHISVQKKEKGRNPSLLSCKITR